ncbi:MAG: hypothetical protein R3E11_00120 [Sphingobium sp.]|jgi:hypothetical protein|uniref:Lipoprotein n=1 Tax=Novosphingobium malaysiense TaxID=1348853 RepID=A0A0B1ZW88_9SPHN|nr:hypothetical protein LK12_03840 [Novosphingobium malaysiense]MCP5399956.1 hypothetical protein [Sphingomonas sp.]
MRSFILTRAALFGLMPAAALLLAGCDRKPEEASQDMPVPAISESAAPENETIAASLETGEPEQYEKAATDVPLRTPVEPRPGRNSGAPENEVGSVPKATQPAAPQEALPVDPHAGHDMSTMSNHAMEGMEHK